MLGLVNFPLNSNRSGLVIHLVCFVFLWMLRNIWMVTVLAGITLLPMAHAAATTPFPDILFTDFSELIQDQFGTEITLTTVLVILFSLTNNSELLNLHARQQNPSPICSGELRQAVTGWMKAFLWSLHAKLGKAADELLQPSEQQSQMTRGQWLTAVGKKNGQSHPRSWSLSLHCASMDR